MKQPYNTTIYNTALYMRLSRDDENYGDSVSIETQRTILQQYAKEQGLHVVGEYVDDGWSGTNFERPDFQRMMDDMEAGKVNCIVTKDLSRFGREHVMMDYYLEFLFPEKRVRYIAVAENEDTEKGLSDFVPFKNLFNEWFAKDTSRKVKAAFKAKFATGQRKNQGADTSHHECVVSAPWFSECLISGRCSTETAHILPGYPPADVSKSRPAVPAASRKKLRQCRR